MSPSTKQRRGGGRRRRSTRKGKIDSNSSASFIGSNVDILTLILTRLPSKSLLVFKSVSKQWLSMINDPRFVHKHFIQNPRLSIPGLLYGNDSNSDFDRKPIYDYIILDGNTNSYVPFETLAFKIGRLLRVGIKIVQSCNGLLLCSNCGSHDSDRTYYIFNPFTKQYRVLPRSQMKSRGFRLANVCLAFDPLRSPYYKVVFFWWKNSDPDCIKYKIEIYDSETSSLRLSGFDSCNLRAECLLWGVALGAAGMFWKGSLYWCSLKGWIASFDVDQELVGVVPLPSSAPANGDFVKSFDIAEYGGHFYLIERDWDVDPFGCNRFCIFEMDSADYSWIEIGQVDVRLNPYAGSPCSSTFLPRYHYILFIIDKEDENESTEVVLLTKESSVPSYDLKDMSFKKIHDLSAQQEFDSFYAEFHQYIESLACV